MLGKLFKYGLIVTLLGIVVLGPAQRSYAEQAESAESEPSAVDSAERGPDPAYVSIDEEEVVRLIRKLKPEVSAEPTTMELTAYSHGVWTPATWRMSWADESTPFMLETEVDAVTGNLLYWQYYTEEHWDGKPYPAAVTRETAKATAERFIRDSLPTYRKLSLVEQAIPSDYLDWISPLFGPAAFYVFAFELAYDGIPTDDQLVLIMIDADGEVFRFQLNGAMYSFPESAEVTLTAEQAKQEWRNGLKLELVYSDELAVNSGADDSPGTQWRLVYVPKAWNEKVYLNGSRLKPYVYEWENVSVPKSSHPFVKRAVTPEQAAAEIAAYADIPPESSWEHITSNYHAENRPNAIRIIWKYESEDGSIGEQDALVDRSTGQLLAYSSDYFFERRDGLPTIKQSDALQAADEWMSRYVADADRQYKRYELTEEDDPDRSDVYFMFDYQLFHRDIPVMNAYVTVTIDGEGKLAGFRMNEPGFPRGELALDEAKITAEQAEQALDDRFVMKLKWVYSYNDQAGEQGKYVAPAATLAYVVDVEGNHLGWRASVDAATGEVIREPDAWRRSAGGPLPEDARQHRARDALQLMWDHGVLLGTESSDLLEPDRPLKRGEWLGMVHAAIRPDEYRSRYSFGYADEDGGWSAYAPAVAYLAERGLLERNEDSQSRLDEPLTREELAAYLAHLTGYAKLSTVMSEDPTVAALKDYREISDAGAVTLALKLGLLTTSNGLFRPGATVSLAEGAIVLSRLADKQASLDHPLQEQSGWFGW